MGAVVGSPPTQAPSGMPLQSWGWLSRVLQDKEAFPREQGLSRPSAEGQQQKRGGMRGRGSLWRRRTVAWLCWVADILGRPRHANRSQWG